MKEAIATRTVGTFKRCSPLEYVWNLGRRGQQDRGTGSQRRLDQDVPGAEQARLGDRKWTDGNLGRHPDEWDEKGKQHKGQIDGHPGYKELGWYLGKSEANHQDQRVATERLDRGRRRRDHAEHEGEQPYELDLSRKMMNRAVPVIVQGVGM